MRLIIQIILVALLLCATASCTVTKKVIARQNELHVQFMADKKYIESAGSNSILTHMKYEQVMRAREIRIALYRRRK
jgi:hypothetical protein